MTKPKAQTTRHQYEQNKRLLEQVFDALTKAVEEDKILPRAQASNELECLTDVLQPEEFADNMTGANWDWIIDDDGFIDWKVPGKVSIPERARLLLLNVRLRQLLYKIAKGGSDHAAMLYDLLCRVYRTHAEGMPLLPPCRHNAADNLAWYIDEHGTIFVPLTPATVVSAAARGGSRKVSKGFAKMSASKRRAAGLKGAAMRWGVDTVTGPEGIDADDPASAVAKTAPAGGWLDETRDIPERRADDYNEDKEETIQ